MARSTASDQRRPVDHAEFRDSAGGVRYPESSWTKSRHLNVRPPTSGSIPRGSPPRSRRWPTQHAGNDQAFRNALAQLMKAELAKARAEAEAQLLRDRHGRRCAERLCFVQDEIIRLIFMAATQYLYNSPTPSSSERMSRGGDRRLRPRPDGAGVRHRSAVRPALQADRLGRAGRRSGAVLAVGHRPEGRPRHPLGRRMHPAGAGRHDDPHRDPGDAFSGRRQGAVQRAGRALRQGSGRRHRRRIRHRQARRARGTASPLRPVALSGRAQRQGRQGRPARPAHAVLDRQIRLPRPRDQRAARPRRVRPDRIPHLPPLRGFPLVGALQSALPDPARRGAAVVRPAARDRGAARLHLASRDAGRRTLHEALLPDRQGSRQPHRDPVRQARGPAGQAGAGAVADDGAAAARHHAPPGAGERRLRHRQQPHQLRDAGRVQARPGQSDPDLPAGAEEQPRLPPRRDAAR